MEISRQKNGRHYPYGITSAFIIVLLGLLSFQQAYATFGPATRYEAENGFNSMSSNSSANAGYSGSGYVTGLTQNGSETKFDKGFSSPTLVKLDIRYANGTGANVTNLALYVGSNQKVQDLVFPSTGSWTTWGTITVTYTQDPSWGSNIIIKSTASVSTSANIDYTDLSVDDGTGTSTVSTPTFNPAAGTYSSAQTVTINTSTSGASIRYTTDGSTPTASSTLYSSPITVSTTQTVKAIGILSGSTNSAVGSAAYTISVATPTVATPSFSPAGGTYTSAQTVTISTTTSSASIRYTTDGTTPTAGSTVYSSPITVSSTQTVKAIGILSGSNNSAVASAAYTINTATPTVATPTFSPGAGTYTAAQSVSISTSTSGATIYYTTDGSTPTTSSSVYSSAINVASTQTLKALATKSGSTNSAIGSAAYTINTGGGTGTGNITREYWAGITGTAISNLTSNASYPNSPTSTSLLTSFESPTNVADNYGQKVKGYVTAPTTGSYTFWIAADDDAELWLSTDGTSSNKVKIASVTGWTGSQEWTKYSSQTSASISLTAGTQYYIEALHKEGGGGDNLAVAWQIPGGSRVIIPGSALSTTLNGGGTTTVATPTFSPGAGTYTSAQTVTISTTTSGASIRYTTDGSTPTASSTLYSSPITVSTTQTVKAIGILSGSNNSTVGSAAYTINTTTPTVATPTFSPGAGTYTSAQTVTISTTTSGASIRYTTDGSIPTASSTLYSSPISVSTTQTVKAIGILSGSNNSAVASAAYTINTGGGNPPNGSITRQIWTGISGTSVSTLTNNVNYPNNPSVTATLTSFQTTEYGDSYGQRIKGYVVPSVTGSYQFFISGDDDAELWLSTTEFAANKVKIASYTGWTNALQWDKYGSQASSSISLTAGKFYYIEALHKEDNGGDHVEVGWKTPGSSTIDIIPGSVLSTQPGTPLPAPTSFSLTAPASGATGVSRVPTFTWGTSNNTASYTLVVSTSSSYTSPIINQAGIINTSYTPSSALATSTTYYWKVTAVGEGGSTVATNAGISFTTQAIPAPGSFSQTSPASGATGVAINPSFAWGTSLDATSYTIVVSTSSSFASPVVNQSGITGTNYSPTTSLALSTTYYWKVTAVNASGSTIASNAGISFTTGAVGSTYYISASSGNDSGGDGSSGNPWRTLSYAASHVPANQNKTIYINAGTYTETQAVILPTGINVTGAGESTTFLKAGDLGQGGGKEDFTGSLIQLVSAGGGSAPANGNQTLSGFTIDGSGRTLKAGIWVQSRNNVIIHHVTIKDCAQRGAVVCYGAGNEPPYYITGLKIYNVTINNSGVDLADETLGNLCIGQLDGADIYNITINDTNGYGIKFIFNGYYKNNKIHDCTIRVNEVDSKWDEDISMELWDIGPGNEIYNIDCNTWLSLVNFAGVFANVTYPGQNLKLHNIKLVDADLSTVSFKETIECAIPGVEIYDSYFQDKGFGIAVWIQATNYVTIRNNIFYNSIAHGTWTDAGAVYIDNSTGTFNNISIYNNVFDNLKTLGTQPLKNIIIRQGTVNNVNIKNNVTLNFDPASYDVYAYTGTNVTYSNNLKYNSGAVNISGSVSQSGNFINDPGFKKTGLRWDTYYQPASASSFVVDKGVNVGIPYSGTAPDLGKWELGLTSSRLSAPVEAELGDNAISTYPNPTTGIIKINANPDVKILSVHVSTTQGKTLLSKSAGELTSGEIDLSAYPNDIYILSVKHQRGMITKKIVLVK